MFWEEESQDIKEHAPYAPLSKGVSFGTLNVL